MAINPMDVRNPCHFPGSLLTSTFHNAFSARESFPNMGNIIQCIIREQTSALQSQKYFPHLTEDGAQQVKVRKRIKLISKVTLQLDLCLCVCVWEEMMQIKKKFPLK